MSICQSIRARNLQLPVKAISGSLSRKNSIPRNGEEKIIFNSKKIQVTGILVRLDKSDMTLQQTARYCYAYVKAVLVI